MARCSFALGLVSFCRFSFAARLRLLYQAGQPLGLLFLGGNRLVNLRHGPGGLFSYRGFPHLPQGSQVFVDGLPDPDSHSPPLLQGHGPELRMPLLVIAHYRRLRRRPFYSEASILEAIDERMAQIDSQKGDTWSDKVSKNDGRNQNPEHSYERQANQSACPKSVSKADKICSRSRSNAATRAAAVGASASWEA